MKVLVTLSIASAMLLSAVSTASAKNEDVIIGILGGALGGLIVGEAIGHHHHRHRDRERVYIYEQPAPRPVCYDRWVTVWDPYIEQYVQVRKTFCD